MWAYDRGELGDNVEVSRTDDALIPGRRLSSTFRNFSDEVFHLYTRLFHVVGISRSRSNAGTCINPRANPPKDYRVARGHSAWNFSEGDSGAGEYFPDSWDDKHISDSRTVHGG